MIRKLASYIFFSVFSYCCLSSIVVAHEAWLEPTSYQIINGDRIVAHYKIGSDYKGDQQPFIGGWNREFKVTNSDFTKPIEGEDGQRPAVQIEALGKGLNILSLHTSTSRLTFRDWKKFTTYLSNQGLDRIQQLHEDRGLPKVDFVEGYRRCAKALVQVGDTQGADKAVGMPLELVVRDGLYGGADEAVEVELLWQGRPLAGAQLQVWDARDKVEGKAKPQYFTTDEDGFATFKSELGGQFMLSSVHMVESDDPKFAWQSYWANLTFER